ncbi:MAG: di-heme oxidoredictase family protein, partial [Polyangia bacterium]
KENNVVGRFGWKAQNATLHVFAGDAYLNEMGITNPSFPKESCPNGDCAQLSCNPVPALNDDGGDVDAFANFMRLLAPPPRGPLAPNDKEGENVFARIGCANCHTPTLTTGANGSAALNHKDYHPYSDFLLHDMGALGDGITQNGATGQLMRTAPLWGLRTQVKLLHDARTTSVIDAIHAHDGQGAASRAAFDALNAEQRRKLLAFLASL